MKSFILLIPRIFLFSYKIVSSLFDPNVSLKTKIFYLLSILYVISPIDFIPSLSLFGLIDDLLVILITILVYKSQNLTKEMKKNHDEKIIDGEFRNIESEDE
jgi:uncharacterized membrane protein YkvA (DUF1232 family)